MAISEKTLSILLCILVALTLLTYYHRNPTGDDAWFAEQAYWLQKAGLVRSNFFTGVLGWDHQLLVSHKLFLLLGAGLMSMFGYNLPVVQFVGLLSFCCLIGELILYSYRRERKLYTWYLFAILILVFSNRLLVKMSYENRPEMLLAALGFGSFLCIQRSNPTSFSFMLAGFWAGTAFLAHLNGIIYLLAGFGTLIYLRHYKPAFLFALAGGLTGLLYFLDVVQAPNGFAVWWFQFRHDPATQEAFGLASKLKIMFTYPRLFFYSPEEIALSVLLVFLLWHQRKRLTELPIHLRLYSLFLVVAFWLITKKNSGLYCVLFMPFMLSLVYELYRLKPFVNAGLKLVLTLYFIIGIYGTIEIIITNFRTEYLPVAHQRLRSVVSVGDTGLVPLTYFFNEYERPAFLLGYDTYSFLTRQPTSPEDLAKWATQQKVGFMVMDYQLNRQSFFPEPGKQALPPYRLRYFDGRFAVYVQ